MKRVVLIFVLLLAGAAYGQVSADFCSRSGGSCVVIPQNLTCTNITNLSGATPLYLLKQAGITCVRLFVSINQICPAGVCNVAGSPFKAQMDLLSAAGLKVMTVMYQTPSNLGATICVPPTNATTWAGYVNTILSYAATNYSGVVIADEERNEPDAGSSPDWCPTAGTALSNYESFIGTDGPIIAAANPILLVGGPALASPSANAATWIPGVLTAWPAISLLTYHYYNSQQTTWANYLSVMQNASSGIGATYAAVDALRVTAGSTAKIAVTETNTDFSFLTNCCRNFSGFAPLWNILNFVNYLNAILTYGATSLPTEIHYYSDQSTGTPDFFCLWGNIDTGMDCSITAPVFPYPQYYAYVLFNQYLGLAGGGNVASSISPGSTTGGLSAAAFYTSAADSIVIVNPTASPVSTGTITFNHAGYTTPTTATTYLLNGNSATGMPPTIVPLTAITNGFTVAAITIPAYSTLAVTILGAAQTPTSIVARLGALSEKGMSVE